MPSYSHKESVPSFPFQNSELGVFLLVSCPKVDLDVRMKSNTIPCKGLTPARLHSKAPVDSKPTPLIQARVWRRLLLLSAQSGSRESPGGQRLGVLFALLT